MQKLELVVPVESFRKIPNPYKKIGNGESIPEMYVAICDVTKLPETIPMETNPREQKLTTGVAKKIKESLISGENLDFYLLNRGLLLSVKDVAYNNYSNEMTLIFEDEEVHGDVDGGHTYKIIQENSSSIDSQTQFVKIEILKGVEDIFQRLAAARNTSTQVQDQSIAELENRFNIIKDAISNEPYRDEIFFKENSSGSIDVGDILAILNMFNIDKFKDLYTPPIVSYNTKKKCIEYYINYHKSFGESLENPYVKMKPIMKDIFALYDLLETQMSKFYTTAIKNGKYGAVKGVGTMKDGKKYSSKFYQKDISHSTPKGFMYPILGSFRALLEEKNGVYTWRKSPFDVLNKIGPMAVQNTIELSRTLGNNPNAVGKATTLWQNLYMLVAYTLQ